MQKSRKSGGNAIESDTWVRVDNLLERVKKYAASQNNHAKRNKAWPRITFATEKPIAEAVIFGFDVKRYFADPLFYFEQALREKVWRWENFPDDDTPIALEQI